VRLRRRTAGRIDHQRDGRGIAHGENPIERASDSRNGEAGPQRRRHTDDAGKAHHRHHRNIAAKALRQQSTQRPKRARKTAIGALVRRWLGHDLHIGCEQRRLK
jgi:hypothetical protein